MGSNGTSQCYDQAVDVHKLWNNEPPLLHALPRLFLQMAMSMASNIIFFHILQPLYQPRIVSDIIGGLVVTSLLEKISSKSFHYLWPEQGTTLLHIMGNLGLVFVFFFKGLQLDMSPLFRCGMKTVIYCGVFILIPNIFGITCLAPLFDSFGDGHRNGKGVGKNVYWGSILAITSFANLACVVARLKLLCNDVGKEALSMGLISDLLSWIFLVQVIALTAMDPNSETRDPKPALYVLLFMFSFVVFCGLVIRPIIRLIIKRTPEGENYTDTVIHGVLFMVFACGAVADFLGCYSLVGAFIFGLCIPHGLLASTLMERMEDCVEGVLMPLYYAILGFKFDLGSVVSHPNRVVVVVLAVLIRPLCGILGSFVSAISTLDGIALGVLLSAKGLISVVGIKIGQEREHLSKGAYSGLLLIVLLASMIVGPIMEFLHRRMKKQQPYKQRTVEGAKTDADFRVLTCIHAPRNIPGIINLLEISNVTARSPMSVFALHLVELMGRASAMLIVLESSGDSSNSAGAGFKPFFTRSSTQSYQMMNAFHSFQEQHPSSTRVESLAVVSPLDTMHDDICSVAEDKAVALIILPFHKHQGMDGKLEDSGVEFHPVNQNVIGSATCSVGLLVDRGIGMLNLSSSPSFSSSNFGRSISANSGGASTRSTTNRSARHEARVAMIYIGGPDDREALSYAWRMAGHPFLTLTVIRILVGENAVDVDGIDFPGNEDVDILTVLTQSEREKERDEAFMNTFRERTENDESIIYTEKVSTSGEETVQLLREMENCYYDLYVVGRGQSVLSPLTVGLAEWSECPELGAIGDVLVTSDFAAHASVLVVQQYTGARSSAVNGDGIPDGATAISF